MTDDMTPITIRRISPVTPSVRSYTCDRPQGYGFEPGQATEVAIDRDGWRDETRPFTFTSTPDDDHLGFTIKSYPEHDGVTEQIGQLEEGATLWIGDAWGAITDKGPGVFIAGGAGVTPFLSILRDRADRSDLEGCHLILSCSTEDELIAREELTAMEGLATTFLVTDEPSSPLSSGRLDADLLRRLITDTSAQMYVCGPPQMVEDVTEALKTIGAEPDSITLEDA